MLKIYIANLGKYNEGELVGEWITLPATDEELKKLFVNIKVAHYDEKGDYIPYYKENGVIYEEVAIHTYETDIPGLAVNEYDEINTLNELAEELDSLDEYELETLGAIMEAKGEGLAYALDHLDDVIFYSGQTLEEVAEELVDEGCFGEIPDRIAPYINYEAIVRDLAFDNYYEVSNGVVCI